MCPNLQLFIHCLESWELFAFTAGAPKPLRGLIDNFQRKLDSDVLLNKNNNLLAFFFFSLMLKRIDVIIISLNCHPVVNKTNIHQHPLLVDKEFSFYSCLFNSLPYDHSSWVIFFFQTTISPIHWQPFHSQSRLRSFRNAFFLFVL